MRDGCIFCAIAKGEAPAELVYQGSRVVAFRDRHPQAPVHLLVVPREHVATLEAVTAEHEPALLEMHRAIRQLAHEYNLGQGFRVVFNCNAAGGQTVYHLHAHLLGGRGFDWPPG